MSPQPESVQAESSQPSQYALVKVLLLGATDTVESDCYGVATVNTDGEESNTEKPATKTITVQLMYKYGILNGMAAGAALDLPLTDNLIGQEQYSTPILVDRDSFVEILISGGNDPQRSGYVNLWRMRIKRDAKTDFHAN